MIAKDLTTIPAPPRHDMPMEFEATFCPVYVSCDDADLSLAEEIMRAFRGRSADSTYEPTGDEGAR